MPSGEPRVILLVSQHGLENQLRIVGMSISSYRYESPRGGGAAWNPYCSTLKAEPGTSGHCLSPAQSLDEIGERHADLLRAILLHEVQPRDRDLGLIGPSPAKVARAHLGFSCDSGSSVTLTARMGAARARRFVLMGEMLTSAQAQQAGLVDEVVLDAELSTAALKLAQQFAAGPTLAYGEVKRLFMRAGAMQLEAMLEDEALTLARVAATQDAQEGIAAMVERRKPRFNGR